MTMPNDQAERADDQAAHQQRAAVDALEVDRTEVGQHQVRFTARVPRRCLLRGRLRRLRTERRDGGRPQQRRQQAGQTRPNANATYAAFVSSEAADDANRRIVP